MSDLLSEVEILSRVQGDWTKPSVTFLCITYNQEDYIQQTIKGFLEQKTSFPYEILIHDDCSTDNTRDIIERYRLRYSRIIRCIYQTENQYSKGISPIVIAGRECRGNYVALCEGDDYWISENKVENQFSLIMSDESISMIVSPGKLERNGNILSELQCYYGSEKKEMTAQDILNVSNQFAPTASYLLKKDYLVNARELFIKAPVGDLFIELYSAVYGKVVYYPEVGSVYRQMAKNSWSEGMNINALEKSLQFTKNMKKAIEKSKTISGFENLDWSVKISTMYYATSLLYLKSKNLKKFRDTIIVSYSYAYLNNKQAILFYLKDYMPLLQFLIKPTVFFRKLIK